MDIIPIVITVIAWLMFALAIATTSVCSTAFSTLRRRYNLARKEDQHTSPLRLAAVAGVANRLIDAHFLDAKRKWPAAIIATPGLLMTVDPVVTGFYIISQLFVLSWAARSYHVVTAAKTATGGYFLTSKDVKGLRQLAPKLKNASFAGMIPAYHDEYNTVVGSFKHDIEEYFEEKQSDRKVMVRSGSLEDLLNDPEIPDQIKQEIQSKISEENQESNNDVLH